MQLQFFCSIELLIGCVNRFPLEIGGGKMGMSTYAMGVVANVHVRTTGEGESHFCHFGAYILLIE